MPFILPLHLKKLDSSHSLTGCSFAKFIQKDSSFKELVIMQSHVLIFVQSGAKIMHTQKGDFEIKAKEALFLASGEYALSNLSFERDFKHKGHYEAWLFFFDSAFLLSLLQKYKKHVKSVRSCDVEVFKIAQDENLTSILESFAVHLKANVQVFAPLICIKFEELFLQFLHSYPAFSAFLQGIIKHLSFDLQTLFTYCDKEFLSVQDMADFAKCDIASFSKKFKACFGKSPKAYLDEKRLLKARLLLELNEKNISEICTSCGFSSLSWFIKRFKKMYSKRLSSIKRQKGAKICQDCAIFTALDFL